MSPTMTIDLLVTLLAQTIFHPVLAWLLPLLLYLNLLPSPSPSASHIRLAFLYAVAISLARLLLRLDARLARGTPRRLDWANEVVVITGGLGGLGRLVAKAYGERGVTVAVLDIKEEGGAETREILRLGGKVKYFRCDVGQRGEVEAVRQRIEEDLGTPTILVNNAALVNGKTFLELTAEDVERNYRVNVLASFHTIQTFLPGMLKRRDGGTIVTVSSVLGYLGCASLSDYTSAKAGLMALHASLRAELPLMRHCYHDAVRMVLFTPGQIATPLFDSVTTPSSFLGPVLGTEAVATAVVAAIDGGRNEEISMPLYARWIAWMAVLPPGLRGLVRSLAGLDRAAWNGFKSARRG